MFTVKRLHRLTDYRESGSEGLSMLNMLSPPPDYILVPLSTNFTGWYTEGSTCTLKSSRFRCYALGFN